MKNVFNNNRFSLKSIYGVILAKTFNLSLAVLHVSFMCASKVNFETNLRIYLFMYLLVFNNYVNFVSLCYK